MQAAGVLAAAAVGASIFAPGLAEIAMPVVVAEPAVVAVAGPFVAEQRAVERGNSGAAAAAVVAVVVVVQSAAG